MIHTLQLLNLTYTPHSPPTHRYADTHCVSLAVITSYVISQDSDLYNFFFFKYLSDYYLNPKNFKFKHYSSVITFKTSAHMIHIFFISIILKGMTVF